MIRERIKYIITECPGYAVAFLAGVGVGAIVQGIAELIFK